MKHTNLNVVVIGGGTGIYPVTAALKKLSVNISTIVAVSDSGGSTGRIRDEFGFQPVGDLRQSLAALAEGSGEDWIRKLLLYRFDKGDGLKGHNLGNLILTALQDMTGSTVEALRRANQIFKLTGDVIPAANEVVDIKIEYKDGSELIGEDYLNPESEVGKMVKTISLTPEATISEAAAKAISQADLIIIGPGDYYASLLATLLPSGTIEAFQKSSAKIMYISNLMTRHWQTDHMGVRDHLAGIEEAIQKKVDFVLINDNHIPESVKALYQASDEHPVLDDMGDDPRAIREEVTAHVPVQVAKGHDLHRSYLRHDSQKLETVFQPLLLKLQTE